MNNSEQPQQRDRFEGVDPIEFARQKLAQTLRKISRDHSLPALDKILTNLTGVVQDGEKYSEHDTKPEELILVEKSNTKRPKDHIPPARRTTFIFQSTVGRQTRYCIMLANKPDGRPDIESQSVVWLDKKSVDR